MSTLRELFDTHVGRMVLKPSHLFDDYEPFLARVRGAAPRILEIGVNEGGSLELWQAYFGDRAQIHGIDIEPSALEYAPPSSTVHIGDQGDRSFIEAIAREHGPFDLVIDDGSHQFDHQRASFEVLYPHVTADGVYIVEDSFTSYWSEFGGGAGRNGTFVEYAKQLVDEMHAWWVDDGSIVPTEVTRSTQSVSFLSGAVVFTRQARSEPTYEVRANDYHAENPALDLLEETRRSG